VRHDDGTVRRGEHLEAIGGAGHDAITDADERARRRRGTRPPFGAAGVEADELAVGRQRNDHVASAYATRVGS
jgi:hypothetical protein